MFRRLFFIAIFLPVVAFGQYHISGKVIDIITKKPVASASVFLSNASAGAKTNDDGTYNITGVYSGHYELVVSIIGFVTNRQNVVVNNDLVLTDIQIEQRTIELKEVRIGPDRNWDRNFALFKKEFLGESEFAKFCKILNPQIINLDYDETKGELTASSNDFIEIENKALGYKIKYLLTNFIKTYGNFNQGWLFYEGSAFFEDLQGKKSEVKRWQKNRQSAYLGSDMHFLRSIISNRVEQEGFVARRLIRQPNPDYKISSGKKILETLVSTPLNINDYAKLTDQKNEFALDFKDCLYITYRKMPEDKYYASIISFIEPIIYFDNNGVIINPRSATLELIWSYNRMAETLPVDYQPPMK